MFYMPQTSYIRPIVGLLLILRELHFFYAQLVPRFRQYVKKKMKHPLGQKLFCGKKMLESRKKPQKTTVLSACIHVSK